ncbi:MAG: flavin reductase family protein [Planctomycetaceae bacterium]
MPCQSIRDVIRKLDQEIWIVTTADTETKAGLVATLVSSASIVPEIPRVLVGLGKQHRTTSIVCAAKTFVLNLLGSTQSDLAWWFGLQSGHTVNKWKASIKHATSPDGDPVLDGTCGWLTCRVEQQFDIGDRWLVLAEVLDGHSATEAQPLTMTKFIKTATPVQRNQLLSQQQSDAGVDAQQILLWRQQQPPTRHDPESQP